MSDGLIHLQDCNDLIRESQEDEISEGQSSSSQENECRREEEYSPEEYYPDDSSCQWQGYVGHETGMETYEDEEMSAEYHRRRRSADEGDTHYSNCFLHCKTTLSEYSSMHVRVPDTPSLIIKA